MGKPLEVLNALAIALRLHRKVVQRAHTAAFTDGRRNLAKSLKDVDEGMGDEIGKLEQVIGELTPKKPKRIHLKDLTVEAVKKAKGGLFVVMPKRQKKYPTDALGLTNCPECGEGYENRKENDSCQCGYQFAKR